MATHRTTSTGLPESVPVTRTPSGVGDVHRPAVGGLRPSAVRDTIGAGRLAGVSLGVNWTAVVTVFLIALTLANGQFPSQFRDLSSAGHATAGLATAVLFSLSLVVHELGHLVVARRNGIAVRHSTLWLFGGVARLAAAPPDPGAQLRFAAAGPATSLLLGVVCAGLALGLSALDLAELVVAVSAWTAVFNLLLAVGNLVPVLPLDGGWILAALLWQRNDERARATEVAGHVGQVLGFTVVVAGLAAFVVLPGLGGLWVALVGGIVTAAAGPEGQAGGVAPLDGLPVADLVTAEPQVVPGELTVGTLLDGHARVPRPAFPVVSSAGRLTGLVTLPLLRAVPVEERNRTPVAAVARPLEDVPLVAPDDPADDLLDRLRGYPDGWALVVDDGRVVGMVAAGDVLRRYERVAPARTGDR